jgi:Flp pilus assembly protein TadG
MIRNPRARGERGATLVESALITPILLLFIFGIFEFGFAFRDYLTVANATREGVREASVAGNLADTDYRTLRSIQRATAALSTNGLDLVVVFKATSPTDAVPASCAAGTSVPNVCNVYMASDFNVVETDWGCQSTSNTPPDPIDSPDLNWCPKDRQVSTGSGLDYVGIYVKATHEYVTGLFGDTIVFEDQMILKVEPHD